MIFKKTIVVISGLAVFILLLAGCNYPASPEQPTAAVLPSQTPLPEPTLTPTPVPRSLVVCLGQEPVTLYPYGDSSRAMWSVLEAIYDGPVDTVRYENQAVILQKLPALQDGDAVFKPVDVIQNDVVVDLDGNLVNLQAGTQVLPSGCSSPECAVTWDGTAALKMDQLSLKFKLKPDLKWSDGSPLTAADTVYSYQVAADPASPVSRQTLLRTVSYQALDELSVEWLGVPGYFPARFETLFWLPLPQHAWGKYSPQELLKAEEVNNAPLGWGPYMVQEWVRGDHIKLQRNPNYFRASEGLPRFDILEYRFLGEPADNNLTALVSGECDVVDQTSLLDEELELVLDLQKKNKLKAAIVQGPEWEHLTIGIKPATYDDGLYSVGADRADFFSDVRVRQALAYCIDRSSIAGKLLFGQGVVPPGTLPPEHPLYTADPAPLPYDPQTGNTLLDQAGWKDYDNDPATPRLAVGVPYVADGTPFAITLIASQARLRAAAAQKVAESLASCGVQVETKLMGVEELYASGPEGILFGRQFDLAQFSWESGLKPPCQFYETGQIPASNNRWLGLNVGGYSNPVFDTACQLARHTRFDHPEWAQRYQEVERLFAQELPVIPLYYRLRMAVARPDLCGLEVDPSARSGLWNLESLDYGEGCNN